MTPELSMEWIESPLVFLEMLWMKRSKLCRYMLYLPAKTKQEQESTCVIHRLELRSEPQGKQNVFY